jgi:hypothetical protein
LRKDLAIHEQRYESREGRDIQPHCEGFSEECTGIFVSSSFEAGLAQDLRDEASPAEADGDTRGALRPTNPGQLRDGIEAFKWLNCVEGVSG